MAVVTANANVALNMGTLQVGDWYGPTTAATGSHVAYKPAAGEYADFYGSFYYNSSGSLYDGVVRSVELSYNNLIELKITGLNVDAPDFFEWVYYNDTDYALSVMFGGADTFYGSDRADWLESFAGNDYLYGYGGDDDLYAGSGNDYVDGGAGADDMYGGMGNDVFVVTSSGDRVFEASGEGFDLVYSAVGFSLDGSFIEDLSLTGSAHINATGSSFDNILTGNGGDNVIDGRGGADKMSGGLGHDVYIVDNAGDLVIEKSNQGFDLVKSSVSYMLADFVEDLTLTGSAAINATGNSFDNILTGNGGSNVIDGRAGADKMIGGLGNDVYVVDNASDLVVEQSNQGFDLVKSAVSYTLGDFVEDLTLTGSASLNGTGNAFDNILIGNAGANVLDGRGGADKMVGGGGSDVYVIDNVNDRAVEDSGAGTDLVKSSVAFSLGANVENLTLTGSAAISGVGNGLANTILGNGAANVLRGNGGADVLTGGAGVDVFDFDALADSSLTAFDRITDLTNSDRIDLSGIDANTGASGNQAFRIVDAFSNAAGQMTLDYSSSTNLTTILMDVNGDGRADMKIAVNGDHDDFTNFVF